MGLAGFSQRANSQIAVPGFDFAHERVIQIQRARTLDSLLSYGFFIFQPALCLGGKLDKFLLFSNSTFILPAPVTQTGARSC